MNMGMPFDYEADEMPNIYYIQPYALDLRYGMAINRHIQNMPDDAWIVLTDQDAMFLTPNAGRTISNAIVTYGDNTDIFTCQTNRLGNPLRCYDGVFSRDTDILNHVRIATKLERNHGHECIEIKDRIVAGMCMIFSKSLWKGNKFDNHPIIWENKNKMTSFDVRFCKGIKGSMKKILGLYCWHTYRLDKQINDTKHLEL